MSAKIVEQIASLRADSLKAAEEASRLTALLEVYPDLKRHVGRWQKVVYSSATVNPQCTDYESRRNCGCCNDSPFEIWPYVETPNGRVYSDPPCIVVGEGHYNGGNIPLEGWRDRLRNVGIPEAIVERVAEYFRAEVRSRNNDRLADLEPEDTI
jgi:hypothetical protein